MGEAAAPSLGAACQRAVDRARALGRSIALSVSEPAEGGTDPLAVLARIRADVSDGATPRHFYFEHPSQDYALAAGGRAAVHEEVNGSNAEDRFAKARRLVESAVLEAETWPLNGASAGALAIGGFSFFEKVDAAQWPGFAPADLAMPQWAAIRQGQSARLLVQTAVAPRDEATAVQSRIAAALDRLRDAARNSLSEPKPGTTRVQGMDPAEARGQWTQVVRTARDAIRQGQLRKVVLARPLDLVCTPAPDPIQLLMRLRVAYPECYAFLADPGAGQVYLGATPERLARLEGGRVSLAALAGTFPRGATPEADAALKRLILESPKEREEHAIVVDAMREALAGLGNLDIPDEPEVRALKNVWHLFTPITLVPMAETSLLDLLQRLHPTPAVGGLPRGPALDLMRRLESFDRGWYGAPLGWFNSRGEGEFVVTLRSGVVSGGRVRLFAGGGIVAESDPEREFEETRIKFQPLLSALGQE